MLVGVMLVGVLFVGCSRDQPAASDLHLPAEFYHNGSIVLGSPRLTSGIPGSGPLTMAELNKWLEDNANHEPLDVALPSHFDASTLLIPADNPLTRAKIELGRQLFFDKRLSGIGTFSCATCHQPRQSFSSYQVMPEVGRNASAVINRVLANEQFWDGRASSLEEQPESPIKNPFEMNSSLEKSTENIRAIPGYRIQFERIFGSVTFENICKALACFERTLVTNASAWDRNELTPAAARGKDLFFSDRLACGECHVGPNLSDEQYYNLGTSLLTEYDDEGRFQVTKDETDKGSFKTPSLRNVAKTPPYMHNGVFRTLDEVVDFFNQGGHNDVPTNPQKPLSLTDAEKQDLIEFLKSLTSDLPPVESGRLPE